MLIRFIEDLASQPHTLRLNRIFHEEGGGGGDEHYP